MKEYYTALFKIINCLFFRDNVGEGPWASRQYLFHSLEEIGSSLF